MMDLALYEALYDASAALFKNSLVLPVCAVVVREAEPGGTIAVPEIREALDGRVEGNQIRDALKRLTAIKALAHLPSTRRSERHLWRREEHPLWAFADSWSRDLEKHAAQARK